MLHTPKSTTRYTTKSHITKPKRTKTLNIHSKSKRTIFSKKPSPLSSSSSPSRPSFSANVDLTSSHPVAQPLTPHLNIEGAPTNPLAMLNTRQLHPTQRYGVAGRPKPQFERSPLPSDPLIPKEYKDTHIQYISGYEFLHIGDVKRVRKSLNTTLTQFNVMGRIYMDSKGINLQMCSHPKDTKDVIDAVRSIEGGLFKKTRIFANDIVDTAEVPSLFDKLSILERTILNDGLDEKYSDELNPFIERFNHLEPDQWHQTLKKTAKSTNPDEKPIVLDIRNLYEYELGSFEAIAVDVDAYRDTFSILDTILGIEHQVGKQPYNASPSSNLIQRSQLKRKDAPDAVREKRDGFEREHQQQTVDIGKKLQHLFPAKHVSPHVSSASSHQDQGTGLDNEVVLSNDIQMSEGVVREKPSTPTLPASQSSVKINKDKKLMLYCTGGIRCLKVGSYLHHQGFTDINVLNGGINAYSVYAQNNPEVAEESLFSGSNVVFDHRRAVTVGKKVLSHCHQCDTPSNIQRNCVSCDILFLQCKSCEDLYSGACSLQCSEDAYGLGEYTSSVVKAMGLKPIISPPEKSRIRPRISPYSITQHAPYLDNIKIVNENVLPGN